MAAHGGGHKRRETDQAHAGLPRRLQHRLGRNVLAQVAHLKAVVLQQDVRTMFLPMSWMSPFTVAMTIFPFVAGVPPP